MSLIRKGFWNCCQDKPAKFVQMDSGRYAACASCAATYARHNGKAMTGELPADWTAPTYREINRELAESALDAYREIAHSDGPEAHCQTDVYRNARAVLMVCIINAYHDEIASGAFDAETVYALSVDNGENIAYQIKILAERPELHPFRI